MAIGIALGILIGLLTGSSFLVLLRAAAGPKIASLAAIVTILVQMLLLPALWFGGPWLIGEKIGLAPLPDMLGPYVAALAVTFAFTIIVPLMRWLRGLKVVLK